MTPPVQPVEDPMLRLQYYRETGQTTEAQQYEQYLRETGQLAAPPSPNGLHREYASGQLAKRMQGANEADQADAEGPGYFARLATHVLNAGQGIPGVEAVEAGAGALGSRLTPHPMSYTQSRDALRSQTGNIGAGTSAVEHMLGSVPLLPFLPASPVAAGAALGGADQALSADDESLAERAGKTAIGAGAGGLLGKTLDLGVTAGRSLLATSAARNIVDRIAARTASAKDLYGTALADAKGRAPTKAVLKFVAHPDIAGIIESLQATPAFAKVAPHDPVMLDAVYKTLSDQAAVAKKGLEAVTPGKPNIGRFRLREITSRQQQLLDALDAPGHETRTLATAQSPHPSLMEALDAFNQRSAEAARRSRGGAALNTNPFSSQPSAETFSQRQARELLERQSAEQIVAPKLTGSRTQVVETPAVMPGYRPAVNDFATRSADISAVQRGVDALRVAQRTTLPAGKSMARVTPEAFAAWAKTATPSEIAAAKEGILGGLKGQPKVMWAKILGVPIVPHPSRMLKATPSLLRAADPNDAGAQLAKYGLLMAHAPM